MRRVREDRDLEEIDVVSEEETKQGLAEEKAFSRKKRRGLIEKRRRDRINGCLNELRHLVPKALEKQGSSKLEKAEILSLTVEHLRSLRHCQNDRKVDDVVNTNYHEKGFQQCLSEVKCYISSLEGIQGREVFRNQLDDHLSIYKASKRTTYEHSTEDVQCVQLPAKAPLYSVAAVPQSIPAEMNYDQTRLFNTSYNQNSTPLHLVCTTGKLLPQSISFNSRQYVPFVPQPTAVCSNEGLITLLGNRVLSRPITQSGTNPLSTWPSVVMTSSKSNITF